MKLGRHSIILDIFSRRGIISIAIRGSGSEGRGTNYVTILIVIIVVFRIGTIIFVTAGIIIGIFLELSVIGIDDDVTFGIMFSFSVRLTSNGGTAVVIVVKRDQSCCL